MQDPIMVQDPIIVQEKLIVLWRFRGLLGIVTTPTTFMQDPNLVQDPIFVQGSIFVQDPKLVQDPIFVQEKFIAPRRFRGLLGIVIGQKWKSAHGRNRSHLGAHVVL